MNTSLSLSLSSPAGLAERDLLMLEQKEWGPHTGGISRADLVEYLGRKIYGEDTDNGWGESVDCGMEDGAVVTEVYAYPSLVGLAYRIGCTWGTLSQFVVQELEQDEVLEFSLASEARTKYPSQGIISAQAIGDLYDAGGAVVPLPGITSSLDTVYLSRAVYGKILVRYRVLRHRYSLRIERRDQATTVENFFSSIVYAWWAGGVKHLEIEPPPGAEEYAADSECGRGGGTSSDDDDDDDPEVPTAAGADRHIVYDYCSSELISDNTYEKSEY